MSDLDAMAFNGRNHHGKIEDEDEDEASDETTPTVGDPELWDELNQ